MSTNPVTPADSFESRLSVEQRLKLESDRATIAQSNAVIAQSSAQEAVTQAEFRRMNERTAFSLAVEESGVKFYSQKLDETLILVSMEFEIVTDGNGKVVALSKDNGKAVSLKEAVEKAALKHPSWVDGRSIKRLKGELEADGSTTIKSKSEFTTAQQRIDFINKYGADRFEKLPLRPPSQIGVPVTQEEWRELSRQRKSDLISEKGVDWVKALPKELTEAERNRRAGIRLDNTRKKK